MAASEILDQAHKIAILFGRLDHDRGYLALSECDEGFEPSLSANQVITRWAFPPAHGDGLLDPEMRDAHHQLIEDAFLTHPRIDHRNGFDRDHRDFACSLIHAALPRLVRAARWKKWSRESKR